MLGYGVYAGGVAARVGGNSLDAAAGVLVGLLAGLIHYGAGRFRSIDLQQSFIAGLAAAPLAVALSLVLPVNAGKVMYAGIPLLVPSSLLTIAVDEIANDALESGVLRFMYASLRFVMLGFGIAASLKLWQLFSPLPELLPTGPLPFALAVALLLVGAVGLAICLQAPLRDFGWVIIAACLRSAPRRRPGSFSAPRARGSPRRSCWASRVSSSGVGRAACRLSSSSPGYCSSPRAFSVRAPSSRPWSGTAPARPPRPWATSCWWRFSGRRVCPSLRSCSGSDPRSRSYVVPETRLHGR